MHGHLKLSKFTCNVLKHNLNITNLSPVCYAKRRSSCKWHRRLAKLLLNCNAFEWLSLEQIKCSERHDITAETQAMIDPLLLLTLLVTVPQNTLFPLISLWLADEAPLLANNGQISRMFTQTSHFIIRIFTQLHQHYRGLGTKASELLTCYLSVPNLPQLLVY